MFMKKTDSIRGVVVPMVTPFTQEGDVDTTAVAHITEHIVSAGASVFVLGTTGEGPSIHPTERIRLIEAVIEQTDGRKLIFAGISDDCLDVSIQQARQYAELGVDLVVAHLRRYFPLTDNEMAQYFLTLADHVPVPLILYNMPITTKMSLPLGVIEPLSRHPNIAGIKDSENDRDRLSDSMKQWRGRQDFRHLTGCTALSYTALSQGAHGIVPSPGNLTPSLYCQLYDAVQKGRFEEAKQMQTCSDDMTAMFFGNRTLCHSLPILKAMMHAREFCDPHVLPPLLPVTGQQLNTIKTQLSTLESMSHIP